MNDLFPIGIIVLYGNQHILYCGDSDPDTLPGDWFRNGAPLNIYSRGIIIPYATFGDSGQYQCKRNGTNVFPQPIRIIVYGECWYIHIKLLKFLQH